MKPDDQRSIAKQSFTRVWSDMLHEEEQVGDTNECVQGSSLKLVVRQIACRKEEGSRVDSKSQEVES